MYLSLSYLVAAPLVSILVAITRILEVSSLAIRTHTATFLDTDPSHRIDYLSLLVIRVGR